MSLQLNCDLGESYGSWQMGLDAQVMPFIDQANVACGFHAGDPVVIARTLALAKQHNVIVGAHPAYPDIVGFGRRSMSCSDDEIIALLHYQISAIDGMAATADVEVRYVKPHGALYNDMMSKPQIRAAVMTAVASYHRDITLMLQATPESEDHRKEAEAQGITLWFEAFADRCYDDDGRLLSRTKPGAVHTREKMLAQVKQLCEQGTVTTVSGETLTLQADTLCVHGDNEESVQSIQSIRELMA